MVSVLGLNLTILLGLFTATAAVIAIIQRRLHNIDSEEERLHRLRELMIGKGSSRGQCDVRVQDLYIEEKEGYRYLLQKIRYGKIDGRTDVHLEVSLALTEDMWSDVLKVIDPDISVEHVNDDTSNPDYLLTTLRFDSVERDEIMVLITKIAPVVHELIQDEEIPTPFRFYPPDVN